MPRTRRRDAAPAPPGGSTLTGTTRLLRENLPRPAAPTPGGGPSGAPTPSAAPRKQRFAALRRLQPRLITDVASELKKVTWPTFAETRHLTLVVASVAVVMGLFLGGVDLLFGWVVEKLFF